MEIRERKFAKLVEVYVAARKSYQEAMEKLMEGVDRGARQQMFQAFRDLNEEERGKLETALSDFLTEEQVGKALESLGTFSSTWDVMVDTLAGFELEEEKMGAAMKEVRKYVVALSKAMTEAMESRSFESLRTAMEKAKADLDGKLAEILDGEQMAKWKEATAYRGRRGGGRRQD